METRTHRAKSPIIDDKIDILNRNAGEASPAKQVFETVAAILALVRDKTIDDKNSVQLAEYCFSLCEALKTAIQGKNADGLDSSVRMALEDSERITSEIERTLRGGADMPHIEYNKSKLEGYGLEIQKILATLNAPTSPLDENPDASEHVSHLAPVSPHSNTAALVLGSACGRLVRRAFTPDELPSLIEAVFSSKDEVDATRSLLGDDAQTFVDVIDDALERLDLPSRTRNECLKSLYRTCARHALLPRVLMIPVCYDRTGVAFYRGGFGDVWKGKHCGRDVAVKVIKTYSNSDLQKIIGKFCKEVVTWKFLRHPNILPLIGVTMSEAHFAMISDWMAKGNINEFVKAHPDANRLELLGDVARGLIYVHSQGMVHGDLKGANILINQAGHACLADFGLLKIISDPTNLLSSSSYTQHGTARWMGPELIHPQRFGLENCCPTKSSDCYALGMVIYETISGNLPFYKHADITVFVMVLAGERPPRGEEFTESLWKMLELCWSPQPNNRPSIEDVLRCLEMVSNSSELHSPGADGNDSNSAVVMQKYPFSFDAREFTAHPILGMVARLGHDGTVMKVYGPPLDHDIGSNSPEFPLLQEDLRTMVPQPPYEYDSTQTDWVPKPPILFFTRECLGVKLPNARDGTFEGVNDTNQLPFDAACHRITIRIHFPGYLPSIDVEKTLKHHGGTKAWSMQLSIKNYGAPPGPVTKSRLVQEVSKRILRHIADLEANRELFPFDERAGKQWRLGQGRMKFEHMVITGLINVSPGYWTPIIWVE